LLRKKTPKKDPCDEGLIIKTLS